eukprot:CAMPEP_0174306666 /NCGR_PEP_ID=MMETSP0810-20121108/609_1 /TAXON_ID=73025 ORGANISM="Eutreptiella gymnastica-like, Strain CCMP1594" /NCGR_SAMPLE_ID=MMETSP0810 /ASSEMBLY_ACC=CAM_ASM_000659 /LENGTH=82 /DNA_ID=CAMNT_0015413469 /DNA_START=681 /DNA_END=929 /DNA_ORIENTATION=-
MYVTNTWLHRKSIGPQCNAEHGIKERPVNRGTAAPVLNVIVLIATSTCTVTALDAASFGFARASASASTQCRHILPGLDMIH